MILVGRDRRARRSATDGPAVRPYHIEIWNQFSKSLVSLT